MKSILVLAAAYPDNDGNVALMYVHVRNKYYIHHDIDVTVLNFSAKSDYTYEDIKVITLNTYKNEKKKYDVLVLHAANIRNHYRFLKKYGDNFDHFIFFYHGHEVLKINEVYPEPYSYVKKSNAFFQKLRNRYDDYKCNVWHNYLPKVAEKSDFVYVSNWLFEKFKLYVKLDETDLKNHVHIINNSVGNIFEENSYNHESEKIYDFITIRNIMDNSKYCIDLVDSLARKYKQFKFLVIGQGRYYQINAIPDNVTWLDTVLTHEEMLCYINNSKCGLLLTREDTQGVMTCELATYGVPVITSDIEVCHEMFDDIENVFMISNNIETVDLADKYKEILAIGDFRKTDKFSYKNTVKKEEQLIDKMP